MAAPHPYPTTEPRTEAAYTNAVKISEVSEFIKSLRDNLKNTKDNLLGRIKLI